MSDDPIAAAEALRLRAEAEGDPALAAAAVALLREIPRARQAAIALPLSAALRALGALTDDLDALDAAVTLAREAIPGPRASATLGAALAVLGERTGDAEALGAALEAYEAAGFDDPLNQARMLRNRGAVLTMLAGVMNERSLLIEAANTLRDARAGFAAIAAPTAEAALAAENLCHTLRLLGEPNDDKALLAEAVAAGRVDLAGAPEAGRQRATAETNLANALLALGGAGRAEAVALYRDALSHFTGPADPLRRAAARHNLWRAEQGGEEQTPL